MNTEYLDSENWDEEDYTSFRSKDILQSVTEKEAVEVLHSLLYAYLDRENWSYNDYHENVNNQLDKLVLKYDDRRQVEEIAKLCDDCVIKEECSDVLYERLGNNDMTECTHFVRKKCGNCGNSINCGMKGVFNICNDWNKEENNEN